MSVLDLLTRTKASLLFVLIGVEKGRFPVKLKHDEYIIGRATKEEREKFFKTNDDWIKVIGDKIAIRPLLGSKISRKHAKLHWNGSTYRITALKDMWVNGKKITGRKTPLRSGDKLLLKNSFDILYFI
ncbi:FHA domain-containing protein [Candidatus Woesearchaeota archaeon]|nr:FHA domain-containing protein [Candidatus Woesearchaeota archaeon]